MPKRPEADGTIVHLLTVDPAGVAYEIRPCGAGGRGRGPAYPAHFFWHKVTCTACKAVYLDGKSGEHPEGPDNKPGDHDA